MNSWQSPVAGEPSLGTGHWHGDTISAGALLNQANPVAGTFYSVTFAGAPSGAKCAWATVNISRAAAGILGVCARKNGDSKTAITALLQIYNNNTSNIAQLLRIPIDVSKIGQVASYDINATALIVYDAQFYDG